MAITCQEVCRDISDYVDDELDAKQRTALEEHFAECRRCTAVLEGTFNVIRLYRDERTLPLPAGFHDRLRRRLDERPSPGSEERIHASRRAVLAWALTAAAAIPLSFALFFAKRTISSRLGHQTPWDSRDPHAVTGLVAVSQTPNDMVFHIPGCSHLHGKPKFLQVEEAIREGYSPCPICIGKYTRQKKG